MKPIPDDLICLSTVPHKFWVGLTVYHPMSQAGTTAYWKAEDFPYRDEEDGTGYIYDVGTIESFNKKYKDEPMRVCFKTEYGSLTYCATNLWVRKQDIRSI